MTDLSDGFLEEQVTNLEKIKQTLECELQEEYQVNRDLRRENKDFWDLAMEEREKAAKATLSNLHLQQKVSRLQTVVSCLQEVNAQMAASRLASGRDAKRCKQDEQVMRGK